MLQIDLLIVKSCSVLDFFLPVLVVGVGRAGVLLLLLSCGGMIVRSSGCDLAEFERERERETTHYGEFYFDVVFQ